MGSMKDDGDGGIVNRLTDSTLATHPCVYTLFCRKEVW